MRARRSIGSRPSCAAPTPRGSTSRPRRRACSPPRSACRACMRTISSSSRPACCSTTRSTAGAATRPARRTTGRRRRPRRQARMTDIPMSAKIAGHGVSMGEAFRVWLRVALLSFGGPAGQIAVMHRILVEEKRWISEARFLHALNYCMLLPGPEAQQLATYIGWLMHRTAGGLMAGLLFILPGIVCIMALSYIYAAYGNVGVRRGAVLRAEGGGAGDRPRGGRARRQARAAQPRHGRARRARLRRDLLLRRAVSADRPRRGRDRLRRREGGTCGVRRRRPWRAGRGGRRPTICSATSCPPHARPSLQARAADGAIWLALWLVPVAALLIWLGPRTSSARSPCSSPRWRW